MSDRLLYPPAPRDVPEDFAQASRDYRFRVVVLMVSLALFLLVYLALVIGAAYLTYFFATHPFGRKGEWNLLINGLGTLAAAMLFLFLLKGLFKPADRFFGAASEVKITLQARVQANALELARHGLPKAPFYLTGQAGGQPFSVHAEGERMILTNADGRQEIDLLLPQAADR